MQSRPGPEPWAVVETYCVDCHNDQDWAGDVAISCGYDRSLIWCHIRQGLMGRPIFSAPLESNFGWLGLVSISGGLLIYGLAVWQNWTSVASAAPWFAPAVSAIMVLTGIQLLTSWLLIILLAELSKRDLQTEQDLNEVSLLATGEKQDLSVEVAASIATS